MTSETSNTAASTFLTQAPREALWGPVLLLTLVNIFNYIDRFVITALLPDIQAELGLSNTQGGMLGTAFIFVYFVTSPVFGWLGDRGRRNVLIAVGVALWSVSTGLAGLAVGFVSLLLARAAVGVGEAAYGTLSPPLLADYVPMARRGRMMAIFFLAIPVGSAFGYLLGGLLGEAFGWRHAFFAVGLPGLLLALLVARMWEPQRGRYDPPDQQGSVRALAAYRELAKNRVYVWTVAGYVAYTFGVGGLAFWMPSYLFRVRGFAQGQGMLIFGGITVVTGFVGTLCGGFVGDQLQKRSANGYTWLSVVVMSLGSLLALGALRVENGYLFLALLTAAELFIFANTGPVNALLVNTVRPGLRATAAAAAIFMIHLLGDLISPTLIGAVADQSNLASGMLLIPAVLFASGVLWLGTYSKRRVPA